jgi:plastocyanin
MNGLINKIRARLGRLLVLVLLVALSGCRVDSEPAPAISSKPVASIAPPTATLPPRPTRAPIPPTDTPTIPTNVPRGSEIDVGDDFYYPRELTITPGTTVRWRHVGGSTHNVLGADGAWGVITLPVGSFFEHRFTREGVYEFYCAPHPEMKGRIVVKP